jgi:hypothetical protein
MKKSKLFLFMAFLTAALTLNLAAGAQNETVREARSVEKFNSINIGGAFDIELTIGEPVGVEIETKAKYTGDILTEVTDGTLKVSSRGIKNNTPLNVYITVPSLERIELHGAASLETEGTLAGETLALSVSGAAEAELTVDVATLSTEASGASDLELAGKATNHSIEASGAATVEAKKLQARYTDARSSGAASVSVTSEQVTGSTSGAGEIYANEKAWDNEEKEVIIVEKGDNGDTTIIRVPEKAIVITEDDDSVTVKLGNRMIIVDEDGDLKTHRCGDKKFNGHWAGFDIGLNGYVTPDFNMNFPKEYEYLDLRMEKSIAVNLNFLEQNIPFTKNQKFGMVTGLGLSFNNYRFMKPTRLSMDSSMLIGYLDEDISIRKSKLTAFYVSLPVLLEFQTAPIYHSDGFHLSAGMIVSARLSSHTKKYYNELNHEFNVTRYNPETGNYEVAYTAVSPGEPKAKAYGDWFLQPFKFDATVRIGWNFLNFWATYQVNSMFRKDKGPELYPWSAGITIAAF